MANVQTVQVVENGKPGRSFTIDWDEIAREKAAGAEHQASVNIIATHGTPKAALAAIKFRAAGQVAKFTQYAGHFDGGWKLGRVTRNVSTKLGKAFLRGDYIIYRDYEDASEINADYRAKYVTAWSLRNRIETSAPRAAVKEVAVATETVAVAGPNSMNLSACDPRVTNVQLRRVHNASVVHSRNGWTNAEALEAVARANRGEVL